MPDPLVTTFVTIMHVRMGYACRHIAIRPMKHDLLFLIIAHVLCQHPHQSFIIGLISSRDPPTPVRKSEVIIAHRPV